MDNTQDVPKLEQLKELPKQPEALPKPHSRKMLFIGAIFIIILLLVVGLYQIREYFIPVTMYDTIVPTPTAVPTTDPTVTWDQYQNILLGLTLKYPPLYTLSENDGYISFLSPLDPNKVKSQNINENEMKVEIYYQPVVEGDTLESFVDSSIDPSTTEVLSSEDVMLSGIPAKYIKWSGFGDGEGYYLINNGYKISIIKFPLDTQRESEYQGIISSLKFN